MRLTTDVRTVGLIIALLGSLVGSEKIAFAQAPARWAVIVGLDYNWTSNNHLTFPLTDAKRFRTFLNTPEDHVVFLTDNDSGEARATKTNILRAIRQIAGKAKPADTFWFYFSGHGQFLPQTESSFLIPADIRALTADSGISVRELRALLADAQVCRAGAKILALDACESGSDKLWQETSTPTAVAPVEGLLTFAAARPDRKAFETESAPVRGGIFTYYLCCGLAGAMTSPEKPMVTLDDLQRYVVSQVNAVCERIGKPKQEPVFLVGNKPSATLTTDWKQISVGQYDAAAIARLNPNAADSLTADAYAERPILEPGMILVVTSNEESIQDKALAALNTALLAKNIALYSGEIAPDFLAALHDPKRTAEGLAEARRMSARLLLRVSITVSRSPSTFQANMLTNNIVLHAELMDVYGAVKAAADVSSPAFISTNSPAGYNNATALQVDKLIQQFIEKQAVMSKLPVSRP